MPKSESDKARTSEEDHYILQRVVVGMVAVGRRKTQYKYCAIPRTSRLSQPLYQYETCMFCRSELLRTAVNCHHAATFVDLLGLGKAVWAWSSLWGLRLTSRGLTCSRASTSDLGTPATQPQLPHNDVQGSSCLARLSLRLGAVGSVMMIVCTRLAVALMSCD